MMLHCPCCHAQFSVEAITQDAAARELLGLKGELPPATFSYLALFRSEKRALSWERALKLAREVVGLMDGVRAIHESPLQEAMVETVEALRGKGKGPLKNHNYLKRVLESRQAVSSERGAVQAVTGPRSQVPASKTASAIGRLEQWKA